MSSIAVPIAFFAAGVALGFAGTPNAAFAQGAPTVRVIEEPVVVQPPPFATRGQTVVVPRTRIEIDEGARGKSAVRAVELPPVGQPPLPNESKAVGPRTQIEDAAPAKSKIISGDALGRKQKDEADNTAGED